jgi:hypothetical protein
MGWEQRCPWSVDPEPEVPITNAMMEGIHQELMGMPTFQTKDHLFAVKVVYLLDRVFQTSVNTLSESSRSKTNPIQAAKRHFKYLQEEEVNGALLNQIQYERAPNNIQLPASIMELNNQEEKVNRVLNLIQYGMAPQTSSCQLQELRRGRTLTKPPIK